MATAKTYTVADLATKLATTPKNMRRRLRSADKRIGQGNRHAWTKPQFDKLVKQFTRNDTAAAA